MVPIFPLRLNMTVDGRTAAQSLSSCRRDPKSNPHDATANCNDTTLNRWAWGLCCCDTRLQTWPAPRLPRDLRALFTLYGGQVQQITGHNVHAPPAPRLTPAPKVLIRLLFRRVSSLNHTRSSYRLGPCAQPCARRCLLRRLSLVACRYRSRLPSTACHSEHCSHCTPSTLCEPLQSAAMFGLW
jgi:hypothetical protein